MKSLKTVCPTLFLFICIFCRDLGGTQLVNPNFAQSYRVNCGKHEASLCSKCGDNPTSCNGEGHCHWDVSSSQCEPKKLLDNVQCHFDHEFCMSGNCDCPSWVTRDGNSSLFRLCKCTQLDNREINMVRNLGSRHRRRRHYREFKVNCGNRKAAESCSACGSNFASCNGHGHCALSEDMVCTPKKSIDGAQCHYENEFCLSGKCVCQQGVKRRGKWVGFAKCICAPGPSSTPSLAPAM